MIRVCLWDGEIIFYLGMATYLPENPDIVEHRVVSSSRAHDFSVPNTIELDRRVWRPTSWPSKFCRLQIGTFVRPLVDGKYSRSMTNAINTRGECETIDRPTDRAALARIHGKEKEDFMGKIMHYLTWQVNWL